MKPGERHDERHEGWLRAAVLGDERELDAPARAALASCTRCAERRAELESTALGLERIGEREREDLSAARQLRSVPGDERVREVWNAQRAPASLPQRSTAAPRVGAWRALAIAASLTLVALAGWQVLRTPHESGTERTLGTERPFEPMRLAPDGEFSWRYALPKLGRFEVRVYAADGAADAEPLEYASTTESRWRPSNTQFWPREIEWQVRVLDASSHSLAVSPRARASLSH